MKDFIAVIATFVFVLATLCLMLHSAAWVLGNASLKAALGWFLPIGAAALAMAVTDAPAPIWENDRG